MNCFQEEFLAHTPTAAWIALLSTVILSTNVYPCSRYSPVSNVEMVKQADAIVRGKAVEYSVVPRNPNVFTTGEPDSTIRFEVLEVIRGPISRELILPGYLVDRDDFNDHVPPYKFVRPGGRSGSCFANWYRRDGRFLLLLKKTSAGKFTVSWYALGPVNEQLHSANDPWLLWVRDQAKKQRAQP